MSHSTKIESPSPPLNPRSDLREESVEVGFVEQVGQAHERRVRGVQNLQRRGHRETQKGCAGVYVEQVDWVCRIVTRRRLPAK